MKAFVYVGGEIFPEYITHIPEKGNLTVAADSGMKNAARLGVTPDIFVGDFDSYDEKSLPDGIEKIKVPPVKDLTDAQIAVSCALEKGAREIVIIGGISGRLDHTLSNTSLLEDLSLRRVHAFITDGRNRVRFLSSTSILIGKSPFRYISIIAVSEKLKGVDIEGCKYPLKNAVINRGLQYAVSNEIEGNCALISIKKGAALIIESRDI